MGYISSGTIFGTIKSAISAGKTSGHFLADKSLADCPTSTMDYHVDWIKNTGANSIIMQAYSNISDNDVYWGRANYADSSFNKQYWVKQPTRPEINSLNNKFYAGNSTAGTTINLTVVVGHIYLLIVHHPYFANSRGMYTLSSHSGSSAVAVATIQNASDATISSTDKTTVTITPSSSTIALWYSLIDCGNISDHQNS